MWSFQIFINKKLTQYMLNIQWKNSYFNYKTHIIVYKHALFLNLYYNEAGNKFYMEVF